MRLLIYEKVASDMPAVCQQTANHGFNSIVLLNNLNVDGLMSPLQVLRAQHTARSACSGRQSLGHQPSQTSCGLHLLKQMHMPGECLNICMGCISMHGQCVCHHFPICPASGAGVLLLLPLLLLAITAVLDGSKVVHMSAMCAQGE
jgi:hypothetical protein